MSAPRTLETAHLQLRPYLPSDRHAFVSLNTDPVVRRHMNGPMAPAAASARFDVLISPAETTSAIAWAVIERATDTYIGHAFIDLDPSTDAHELGFLLSESHWGRGLATELARRIASHALTDLGIPHLTATVDPDNRPSQRVLEKAGFTKTAEEQDEHGPYFVFSRTVS